MTDRLWEKKMGKALFSITNGNVILEIYDDVVVITRKGVWSYFEGTKGERIIPIDTIGYIKVNKPGIFSDTDIEFGVPGSDKKSTFENTFPYDREDYRTILQIQEFIESKIRTRRKGNSTTIVNQKSAADEIKKFKELLDIGAITEDEFNSMKKKLMNM